MQQLVRFVIEQYRDELVTSLQGSIDESRVAEDREAVASDLLNILHRCVQLPCLGVYFVPFNQCSLLSIPIQSIATNGPSLVSTRRRTSPRRRTGYLMFVCRFTRSVSSLPHSSTRCARQRQHQHRPHVHTPTYVSFTAGHRFSSLRGDRHDADAAGLAHQGTSYPSCPRSRGTICEYSVSELGEMRSTRLTTDCLSLIDWTTTKTQRRASMACLSLETVEP